MKIIGGERIRMADGTVAIVKHGGGGTLCICTIDGVVLANVPQDSDIDALELDLGEWSDAVDQHHVRRLIDRTATALVEVRAMLDDDVSDRRGLEQRRDELQKELNALVLRVKR